MIINDENPTDIWHGISHGYLLKMCGNSLALEEEKESMSNAAALMVAGECSEEEWLDAERAVRAIERRLCAAWEAKHGEPPRNRFGQYAGDGFGNQAGIHPALRGL